MRKKLAFLLPLLGLLCHPGHSQSFTYTLLPGDVVKRRMVGIDTASYGQSRRYMFRAGKLILAGENRLAELEHKYDLSQAGSAVVQAELQRTRDEAQRSEADLVVVKESARKLAALPLQKPILVDPRTYEVGGLAGLAGIIIGLLLHK